MRRETLVTILKDIYQYSDNIADVDLYDEAIATLERYFEAMPPETLYHRSRVDVLAYLALIYEREGRKSIPVDWILREIENPKKCDAWRNTLQELYYLWRDGKTTTEEPEE